jgi:hypothetical protein
MFFFFLLGVLAAAAAFLLEVLLLPGARIATPTLVSLFLLAIIEESMRFLFLGRGAGSIPAWRFKGCLALGLSFALGFSLPEAALMLWGDRLESVRLILIFSIHLGATLILLSGLFFLRGKGSRLAPVFAFLAAILLHFLYNAAQL